MQNTSLDKDIIVGFIANNQASLASLPGEHYAGDITGHGYEWRTEYVIDYAPANEDEDDENEYTLVFSIYSREGLILASLELEYRVAEEGTAEKHSFDLSCPSALFTALAEVVDQWNLHKDADNVGNQLIAAIQLLMKKPGFAGVTWAK